jgi:hypothetical protein
MKKKMKVQKKKKKRCICVPLVTLHMCNVTNGTSIGNVAHMQRY